jgi:hypothetical protein
MDHKTALAALFKEHPLPWKQGWHCDDNGHASHTIEDANGEEIVGEYDRASAGLYEFLLTFVNEQNDARKQEG